MIIGHIDVVVQAVTKVGIKSANTALGGAKRSFLLLKGGGIDRRGRTAEDLKTGQGTIQVLRCFDNH